VELEIGNWEFRFFCDVEFIFEMPGKIKIPTPMCGISASGAGSASAELKPPQKITPRRLWNYKDHKENLFLFVIF